MKTQLFLFSFFLISFITSEQLIIYEESDNIALLTINRTNHLNALNTTVFDHILKVVTAIDTTKIAALIITGAGEKAFVAGADIYEMSSFQENRDSSNTSHSSSEWLCLRRRSRISP